MSTTASTANIARHSGAAVATQAKKEMLRPVASSMSARPMRLGGDPIGVSRPPTLAP